ncbi:MAG: protein phosphatase 2C domain-containing protein [Bryobacteraceae bacterium]
MLENCGASDKGCVRTNNEDFFLLKPDIGLYLVADGMGGAVAGEEASRLAAETVAEVVGESLRDSGRPNSRVLLGAVEEANRRVRAAARSHRNWEGMGTTLVAVLDAGEELCIASVGDSRAYLWDDGHLMPVTEDQSWVEEVGRPLGLDPEALRTHPLRHVLTMAIGLGEPLTVNHYTSHLRPGAQLLLSSDGLHGVVDAAQVKSILSSDVRLQMKCEMLIQAARNLGGPDNITCVLLRAPKA